MYCVSLDMAVKAISKLETIVPNTPTRAFTVNAYDLLGALGYTNDQIELLIESYPLPNTHARLYLGAAHTTTNKPELKLYLVPVTGANISPSNPVVAGTDQIPNGDFQSEKGAPVQKGEYVYDLIAPCPGTCDYSSPLYQAGC